MTRIILLDSGPLGLLVHPRASGPINTWVARHLTGSANLVIPEITFYEVRRELVRIGSNASVQKLDSMHEKLEYAPVTREILIRASELWAEARNSGRRTASDDALDVDVILAATAIALQSDDDQVVVATANLRHLARFVPSMLWEHISP